MVVCKLCGKECKNNGSFSNHFKFHHNEMSSEIYYDTFINDKHFCIVCDSSNTKFLGITRGYSTTCGDKKCIRQSYGSKNKELYAKRNNITTQEAKIILHEKFMNTTKGSPFTIKFWINKGYSKEEAGYKVNSIRPIRKEYWIERGYSEEKAIEKAVNTKLSNNKKGALKASKIPFEKRVKSYWRRIEYWLELGYTEEEGRAEISKKQNMFSLKKCIEMLGEEKGRERWLERQKKWHKNFKKSNFSKISQRLFWNVYNLMNDKNNIYFATLKNGKLDDSGINNEYSLVLDKIIKPDFIQSMKIIEFDGDYWHGPARGNQERDRLRDELLTKNGYEILHIKERNYNNIPNETIQKCLEFLND